ncbi:hypothetical protein G6O67_004870 [Ophiocordyceps sinensis]|uniref:Uncharacterized protein n=1 Tax=Ophiocordyceps sinensis TaxID=72228 RepID=A0A8H4V5C7_9HYPO|nr:hypothetical protein G6O67_004870 [Ophiocordyceps sinensis]
MPPNSAKAADRKRGLAEADRNTAVSASSKPTKKRVKTATESVAKKQQPAALAHNPQTKLFHPYLPRIPRGPDGEFFVPQILPDECIDAVGKIPMPKSWMVGYDISPDRELTLGSRKWWEEHLPWLEKHMKALKLTPSKWKVRERLLAEQVFLPEDEGFRDWDIICYPIPNSENGEDHDQDAGAEPASSHESSEKGTAKSEADVVRKLASFHPNHKWIGSVRGYDRARWWMQEMLKRDQDEFSTYMYDDFSAYGKLEVLENMFMQFSKAIRSKTTYRDTWPEVEGLVMALHYGLGEFILCEDGGRCSDAMEMVGYLSITALNVLKDQGVLAPNSDIPNLGLVLAVLLQWAWSWTDLLDWENIGWVYRVLDIVEEAGVAVGGTVGFPKVLEEMKKKAPRNGSDKRWKSFSWTGRCTSYRHNYCGPSILGRSVGLMGGLGRRVGPMGGSSYDLTQMTAAKRQRCLRFRFPLGPF